MRIIAISKKNNNYFHNSRIDLAKVELSESDNLISNRLGRLSKSRKHKRNSNSALVQKLKRRRLVFLEDSPDYCRSNSTVGFPGNNIKFTLPK